MSDEDLNEPSRMTGLARRSPAADRGGCSTTRVTTPDHGSAIENWLEQIQGRGPG